MKINSDGNFVITSDEFWKLVAAHNSLTDKVNKHIKQSLNEAHDD